MAEARRIEATITPPSTANRRPSVVLSMATGSRGVLYGSVVLLRAQDESGPA